MVNSSFFFNLTGKLIRSSEAPHQEFIGDRAEIWKVPIDCRFNVGFGQLSTSSLLRNLRHFCELPRLRIYSDREGALVPSS